jgi:ABC-type nitrate/sulfonate/bicarbonate transport system substrate-binding protein
MTAPTDITLGFMPLLDSAILIAASQLGFAEQENIRLRMVRETSWANIRDRVAVGHFDGAHMLAPMPIAFNLGLGPISVPVVAPLALGLGGNAVTVSNALHDAIAAHGAIDLRAPAATGAALKAVVDQRAEQGARPLVFAVVHPYSGHNYELRYWLAACGIDPDRDIEIVIVPPPLMPDALQRGVIDGFCVGEPWNTVAVAAGTGHLATVKAAIWRSSPEKVLGLSRQFVDNNPDATAGLIRAAWRASAWCARPENAEPLAELLAGSAWLDQSVGDILPAISGRLLDAGGQVTEMADFFLPHQRAATFPWQSHALWYYSQMVRWGHVEHSTASAAIARESYRPDLYRKALAAASLPVPAANMKVEGALAGPVYVGASQAGLQLGPDGFFDGRIFDPDHLEAYLQKGAAQPPFRR